MVDNPNAVLYWCLRHGQRRRIATQFGVLRPTDGGLGELPAAAIWLKRLDACGSIAPAMERARQLHHAELRDIEDNIRSAKPRVWRDELEHWREFKYRLLALPPSPGIEHVATASPA